MTSWSDVPPPGDPERQRDEWGPLTPPRDDRPDTTRPRDEWSAGSAARADWSAGTAAPPPVPPADDWVADPTTRRPVAATPPPPTSVPWIPGPPAVTTPPPPAPSAAPEPPRRRRKGLWLVVAAVVVLVAAGGVTAAFWPSSGGTGGGATPTASTSAPAALSATDRFVKQARTGDCVAMTDLLDESAGADAAIVACDDPRTTFTVVGQSSRLRARIPCDADESVRSDRLGVITCLNRVFAAGQCVLANATSPLFVSVVPCDTTPSPPFTAVLRIRAVHPAAETVPCGAGQTPYAVSGKSMCLSKAG